jgi:hypothetical protein
LDKHSVPPSLMLKSSSVEAENREAAFHAPPHLTERSHEGGVVMHVLNICVYNEPDTCGKNLFIFGASSGF